MEVIDGENCLSARENTKNNFLSASENTERDFYNDIFINFASSLSDIS